MLIDVATLFKQMMENVLDESILGRAQKAGLLDVRLHDIRKYSKDKHNRVDDTPYGGGYGMIMQPQPIYACYKDVLLKNDKKPYVIYMSPKGSRLTQKKSIQLSKKKNLFLLCGHYEGVDERVLEEIVDEEISIGDYVLTGGELAALVLIDSVARLVPGVLKDPKCYQEESHYNTLLEHPHYTRPETWRGKAVPKVLLSGNHRDIEQYRENKSIEETKKKRPDLYEIYKNNKV